MTEQNPRRSVTQSALAAAFTEWDRRYREEPERFKTEAERFAESSETYGEACAPYLLAILDEQFIERFSDAAQNGVTKIMPGDDSTWCVHVQGPDELIPTASRVDAVRAAQDINQFATDHPDLLDDEGVYPTVWAVPAKRIDVAGGSR